MDHKKTKQQWFFANYGKLLPQDKAADFLEIGPGAGEICELLTTELGYHNYVGLDITDSYHQASPDSVKRMITVVPNSTVYLNTTTKKFDVILMLHVLEHVPKAENRALISAIHESLRPGGVLIVEVPNIANMYLGPYYRYSDTTHEVGFADCSLEWTLQRGGFTSTEIQIKAVKVPLVSFARFIQAALQTILNGLQRLLMFAYIPSGRTITAMYICAVARKESE